MLPPWLANLAAYSAQVAALVAAAALFLAVLRVTTPHVRLAVWQALLIACLALPFVQPWRPAPAPGPRALVTTEEAADPTRTDAAGPATPAVPVSMPLASGLAAVLAAGALVRFAWLGLGLLRLARYRRDMTLLEPVPPALVEAGLSAGAQATIGVADGLSGPVTFGWRRPLVLLPPAVLSLAPALQQSVVCHELLHVRRRDWIWSVAEELVCAIAWFHPAIWWVVAQIDLAREQHVDAEVVRLTGDRRPYLQALLYLASPERGADLVPASALLRRRHLAKRLLVLVREASMSRQRIVLSALVLTVLLALTAGAAAMSFPLVGAPALEPAVAAPAVERPTAAIQTQAPLRVGGDTKPPKKIVDVRPVYPPDASAAGVEGVVILEILVAEDGTVADVKVLRSVPVLDQAAIDAVRQWVFQPTLLNGAPVPVIMTVTVNFTLDDSAKAEGKVARMGLPGGVEGGVKGGVPGGVQGGVAGGVKGGVTGTPEKPEPPKRIYYVAPVYPEEAHAKKVEGIVILEVRIGTDGLPTGVKALRGQELLTQAAIDAVRKWKWEPPAVPVVATVTVRFTLDQQAEVAASLTLTDSKLEIVRKVNPTYPPEAKDSKLTGTVEVEIVVDENGRVTSARILKGADAFHQAALDAVRQWEFKPAGKPVKSTVEFTFTLR